MVFCRFRWIFIFFTSFYFICVCSDSWVSLDLYVSIKTTTTTVLCHLVHKWYRVIDNQMNQEEHTSDFVGLHSRFRYMRQETITKRCINMDGADFSTIHVCAPLTLSAEAFADIMLTKFGPQNPGKVDGSIPGCIFIWGSKRTGAWFCLVMF